MSCWVPGHLVWRERNCEPVGHEGLRSRSESESELPNLSRPAAPGLFASKVAAVRQSAQSGQSATPSRSGVSHFSQGFQCNLLTVLASAAAESPGTRHVDNRAHGPGGGNKSCRRSCRFCISSLLSSLPLMHAPPPLLHAPRYPALPPSPSPQVRRRQRLRFRHQGRRRSLSCPVGHQTECLQECSAVVRSPATATAHCFPLFLCVPLPFLSWCLIRLVVRAAWPAERTTRLLGGHF